VSGGAKQKAERIDLEGLPVLAADDNDEPGIWPRCWPTGG
jgi:hypothetical protein